MSKSRARKAWDGYVEVVDAALGPVVGDVAAGRVQRLVGFWVCWHLLGGYDGLRDRGWQRHTVWRSRKQFRELFGVEVEDWMPHQSADVVAWRDQDVKAAGL